MNFLFGNDYMDMHIHTQCSDGEESADYLCQLAIKKGIERISFTDHDTMDAYKEIDIPALRKKGLDVVYGVELSVLYKDHRIHMLAYDINPKGFNLLKGLFYKKYPGHRHKYLSAKGAHKLTHLLGGKLIAAHPYKYGRKDLIGLDLVESLHKENLIDGIECFHSFHDQLETANLLSFAKENNLLITIGSDFHDYSAKIGHGSDIGHLSTLDISTKEALDTYIRKEKISKVR